MLYNIGAQHDLSCIWQSENGQQRGKINNRKSSSRQSPKEDSHCPLSCSQFYKVLDTVKNLKA